MKPLQKKSLSKLTNGHGHASTVHSNDVHEWLASTRVNESRAYEDFRILRLPDVEKIVGLKRQQIWNLESQGRFPRRFKILGSRVNGWSQQEVHDWCRARIDGERVVVGAKEKTIDKRKQEQPQ